MKINPSRNEFSPGLVIAPSVWGQPHNIVVLHLKPMPKHRKRTEAESTPVIPILNKRK
jgi:hypothetical protein